MYGIDELEELLYPRYLQGVTDAVGNAGQDKLAGRVLPGYIRAHESADSGGVGIRYVSEIDDKDLRLVGSHHRLELEHGVQNQGACQQQNPLSGLSSGLIGNAEGILGHGEDINFPVKSGMLIVC